MVGGEAMKTLLERARSGESLADLEIVDMHGHFGRYLHAIPDLTAEGLVRVMDRLGVRSILVSHMQCMSQHTHRGNEEVLTAMRAFPGRILGYAVVWPVDGDTRAEMEWCAAHGFTGLKLHSSNGFAYTDPVYAGALSVANERRMPVLLHAWGAASDFAAIRELAAKYPEASFLFAHSGTGGAEAECIRLAREVPNAYLDLAYSQGPRGLVERLVAGAGAEKVLFGSDCYFFSMTQQIGKVLGADLSDGEKRKILSENALRILERVQR